jgi:hypothetical protein
MRKIQRAVAVAILSCFIPAAIPAASAEPASSGFTVPINSTVSRYLAGEQGAELLPVRANQPAAKRARVAKQQTNPGGGGLGTGAKIGIWLGAVVIGSVWAYKTFSVTRGTD